jgi:hypothetical protein
MPSTPTWSPSRAFLWHYNRQTNTFIYNPASYGRTLPYVYSHLQPWFSRTPHPPMCDALLHLQDGGFNNVPLIYASQYKFHDNVSITKKILYKPSLIPVLWSELQKKTQVMCVSNGVQFQTSIVKLARVSLPHTAFPYLFLTTNNFITHLVQSRMHSY